jgi:hypothetical protein
MISHSNLPLPSFGSALATTTVPVVIVALNEGTNTI